MNGRTDERRTEMAKKEKKETSITLYDQYLPTEQTVKNARAAAFGGGPRRLNIGDEIRVRFLVRPGKEAFLGAQRHFCKISADKTVSFFCPGPSCYLEKELFPQFAKSGNPLDRLKIDRDEDKNWLPSGYYIANVLIRGEEHLGPQTLELQAKFLTEFLKPRIASAAKYGHPFDPLGKRQGNQGGYDIDIKVEADQSNNRKWVAEVAPDGSAYCPLSEDPAQIKAWIDSQPDLELLIRPKSYAEAKELLSGGGQRQNPSGWSPPGGSAPPDDDDDRPPPEDIGIAVDDDDDDSAPSDDDDDDDE